MKNKNIIKVRFLKNDTPQGNSYTYYSNELVSVGDLVQINTQARGVVTEIDLPAEAIKDFADKVKYIWGRAVENDGKA
jgi:uncharacterized Zn finger protein